MAFPPKFKSSRRTNATPVGKKGGYDPAEPDADDTTQTEFKNDKKKATANKAPFGKKKKTVGGFGSLPMKTFKKGDKQGV